LAFHFKNKTPSKKEKAPANLIALYKYLSNDTFRRVRKDYNSLGKELSLERDSNAKVVRLLINNSFKCSLLP
jgi:hypothetical protein